MEITLKNFKHYPALSDETDAFSATLYVDGKPVGFCEDDGKGGEICITPLGGSIQKAQANRKVIQAAEEWVKANVPAETITVTLTLPPASMVDPAVSQAQYDEMGLKPGSTSTGSLPSTLESYISDIVSQLIKDSYARKVEAKYRKQCKTKTLFNLSGDKEGQFHSIDRPFGPTMVAYMKEKHPDADIWNYKYGGVLSARDEQKQLDVIRDRDWKKKCQRVTLFRLDDGKVYQNAGRYGYTTRMQLQLMYGDRLVEIINDRLAPLPDTTGLVALYRLHYTETRIPPEWIVGPLVYVLPHEVADYKDKPNLVRYTTDYEEVKKAWAINHSKSGE